VTGVLDDVRQCLTMDVKIPGDRLYIVGATRNELGGSEYYEHVGHLGLNIPKVSADGFADCYRAVAGAIKQGLLASCHGIYRGGLAVHLALVAMGGELGLAVDLAKVPSTDVDRDDTLLFSESAGRFIVSVAPDNQAAFEALMAGQPMACVGQVTERPQLKSTA
jgi:phosphoribosylformylglycinamidine synthase